MTVQAATMPAGNYPAVDLAQQGFQQPDQPGRPQHQSPESEAPAAQLQSPQGTIAGQDQLTGKGALPFARNARGKPVDSEGHMIKRVVPTDEPLQFWYQRKGFNDFLYLEGGPAGPIAYYVDVKALFAGWSIYLRRGPTRQSPPVLHLTKGVCLLWDKGTQVKVEATEAQPWLVVTNMLRKYEFINKYTFAFNGRQYTWEWTELLGGTHYCKDDDTHEVVCIARLRFTLAWQVISAWGLSDLVRNSFISMGAVLVHTFACNRLRGGVEIYGAGKSMVELLLATLAGQIEWRKHNNKLLNVWSSIPTSFI